ncbi:sigma factor [Nonomuraea sp. 10N515B]|uniref:sigma factor n=1 Tax=Nonomuraea sp. 10N515B TaxID=3457422 RepID=UPI003FCCBDDB
MGEAEDVVQEAWLRWERADRSVVISPPAFLALTTTRLAINVVQSARRRRETSVNPWLVETVHLGADHARQLMRRAHEHIATERRQPVDAAAHRRLVRVFLAAAQNGDLAELEELLAADVSARLGDSRAKPASSRPSSDR